MKQKTDRIDKKYTEYCLFLVKSEEIFFGFLGFFIKNNRESNKNRWVERKDIKRKKRIRCGKEDENYSG